MTFQIETDRLLLRDYLTEDLEGFALMSSAPEFQTFYSEDDCSYQRWQQLVTMFIAESIEVPRKKYNLVICDKSENKFIGSVGLRLEDNQQASVGCSLSQSYWHKGIAREALQALLDFGFNQLNLHRVYAETISQNFAAIRLCEQLGFRQEAELIEHRYFKDQWWNTCILAMLATEYTP